MLDIFKSVPGISGLFIASVYGAALSTISSAMNGLSAVVITDFVKPLFLFINAEELKETIAGPLTKLVALTFGFSGIGMAYLCKYLGNTVLQLALSIFGILGGPILGVISLGMFVPYANWAVRFFFNKIKTIGTCFVGCLISQKVAPKYFFSIRVIT